MIKDLTEHPRRLVKSIVLGGSKIDVNQAIYVERDQVREAEYQMLKSPGTSTHCLHFDCPLVTPTPLPLLNQKPVSNTYFRPITQL